MFFSLAPCKTDEAAQDCSGVLPTLLFLCLQAEHAIEIFFLMVRDEVSRGEWISDGDACCCGSRAGANGRNEFCC